MSKPGSSTDRDAPAGLQQTEVGLIPQDWEVKPLSSLGTFMKGKGIKRDDVSDEGLACVRYGELYTDYNDYFVSPKSRIPRAVAETSQPIRYGDLLFAGSGETAEEIGKCAAFLSEEEAYAGGDLVILRPHGQNPLYLGHLLNHQVIARQKARFGQGDAVVHISARNLGMVKVPLPPNVSEQNVIAEALSDVDGLLSALEKLIAKKRAIKQAAMQQLLTGKTRLPGFTGRWEATALGEVAEIKNGATPSTRIKAFWNGSIPWCTPTDITGTPGKYLSLTERSITETGLAACAANLLPPGTLLLCSRATIGEVKIATTHVCTNQGFKSLVCRPGTSNEFMYYLVLTLKSEMVERAIGSTFLEIAKRDLSAIQIRMPRQEEQVAIATVLADMDAEIEALERHREKSRQIKQGMMQQLLTGRIRLVTPEAQAPAAQTDSDGKASKPHSWAFNEAVVISTLAKHFGKENFPLGRKRYTKLSYLLHRHAEQQAEGYLKKAAGPYNPRTRYGGPERIALESGYIREHKNGPYTGFVAADNIAHAEGCFEQRYGPDAIQWLNQFRFKKNDDLELLATVDMAAEELRAKGHAVNVDAVKAVIRSHPEWKAKLDRAVFYDANIAKAIEASCELFAVTEVDNIFGGT